MSWYDTILLPFMHAVAWIMDRIHDGLVLFLPSGPGIAWVFSIVGLTVFVRTLMIPLFVKQTKASRGMQAMQPELQKIQKKYKNRKDTASQMAMQEEMQAMYKRHGTSPFASCMPLLVQMPIFIALFRVLAKVPIIAAGQFQSIGGITKEKAIEIEGSNVFGAYLSESFTAYHSTQARVVIVVFVVLMAGMQFFSMRQLMMKNMPASSLTDDNPMLKQQRMMMKFMPLIMAFTGLAVQMGVLVYWLTTNLWTLGQQYFVIKRMPAPGSEAEKKMKAKRAAKRAKKGLPPEEDENAPVVEAKPRGQRVQPVSKKRQKKQGALLAGNEETEDDTEDEAAGQAAGVAGAGGQAGVAEDAEGAEEPILENEFGEEIGKDGLTKAQRAQKLAAEKAAARKAAAARNKGAARKRRKR